MNRGKCVLSVFLIFFLIFTASNVWQNQKAYGEEAEKTKGTDTFITAKIADFINYNGSSADSFYLDLGTVSADSESDNYSLSRVNFGEVIPSMSEAIGIYTAQDLSDMRNNPALSYVLMNDIDLTAFTAAGDGWIPVGTLTEPFTGTLDGNGHSITGLRIFKNSQNTTSFVGGLFGYSSGMTVRNLALSIDINVVAARAGRYLYLGGIAGLADQATLEGCTVNAKIKGKAETTRIGGLIGNSISSIHDETGDTSIANCTTSGEINTSGREYDLGGVVGVGERLLVSNTTNNVKLFGLCTAPDKASTAAGIVGRFTSGTITGCTNTGVITTDVSNIYMTNTSSAYAGGIAAIAATKDLYAGFEQTTQIVDCVNKGLLSSDRMGTITQAGIIVEINNGNITHCENQGDIRNFTGYEGGSYGIAANVGTGNITGCTNKGDVLCSSLSAAGITDCNYGTISQCSNWGTVTSMNRAAGIAIMNMYGTISNCLNAGEISGSLGSFETMAGGIVSVNKSTVKDCYNIGAVRGGTAGGITASNETDSIVETSMNVGNIYAASAEYRGSIVGLNFGSVQNTYYESDIIPGCGRNIDAAIDGSKGLTLAEWTSMESYVGFKFIADDTSAVWEMSPNTGWPKLISVEEVYVSSLSVAQAPKKLSYLINEAIDTKGLILKATLSNGRAYYLDTGYVVGTYSKTPGTRAITIRFAGKTASYNVSFLYFTLSINTSSCLVLDTINFPGVVKMRYYTASAAAGPYSVWVTSTPMDATDTDIITNDLILNKTYYFKVQPIYSNGTGPVYGYNSIRFKPSMPEILDFYRDDKGVVMNCMPVRFVNGYEMYGATSIGGPYTKIAEATGFSMFSSTLKQGTFYFFVARSYIIKDGVRVYSDYSPVQWGRFL